MDRVEYVETDEQVRSVYADMPIDVITFSQVNDLDMCQGNVVKYVVRYKKKGGIEDLKKARTYIDRMIQREEQLLAESSVLRK